MTTSRTAAISAGLLAAGLATGASAATVTKVDGTRVAAAAPVPTVIPVTGRITVLVPPVRPPVRPPSRS